MQVFFLNISTLQNEITTFFFKMSGTDCPVMWCVQDKNWIPRVIVHFWFLSSYYGVAEDSYLMVFMLCWLVNISRCFEGS